MFRCPEHAGADRPCLAPGISQLRQAQSARAPVLCQSRTPNYGGHRHQSNEHGSGSSRLIIPGQDNPGARLGSQQLVMPGGGSVTAAPLQRQNFRPPPGFMDRAKPADDKKEQLSPQEMLSKLRAGHGHWYNLADYMPLLNQAGYDAAAIENETGIERPRQNAWIVSAQVHASLSVSGEMDPATLQYFDQEDSDLLLYALRYLELAVRPAAATYVAKQELNAQECDVLSRAIRDHMRRDGKKEGFSLTPGDCLAYKYFRDAIETRKPREKAACMDRGLAVADTESARAAIRRLDNEAEVVKARSTVAPQLQVVRMTGEEMSFRPVPLAGNLEDTSPAVLASAPQTRQTGAFHAFEAVGEPGQRWVVLPAWHALMVSRRPVALYVSNCQQVPMIVAAVRPRTEEDRMKLSGPALLLADTDPVEELEPDEVYLIPVGGTGLGIASGRDCSGVEAVCARVLLCCRPPTRSTMPLAADSSALMQL